jgi:hypothetical protein
LQIVLLTFGSFTLCGNALGINISLIGALTPSQSPAGFASQEAGVDVSGNRAVVTAGVFASGQDQGRAFVYDFSNPNHIQEIAMLRASDSSAGNEYGSSVAMIGQYVFVGAHGADGDRGAVYMYDLSDPAHITERKITAFDAAPNAEFGYSLSADGHRLIVGAPKFSAASTQPPAAYVLDFGDPNHITQSKLVPNSNAKVGDFGETVDISGNYAIVGQKSESSQFPFAGAAFLYDLTNSNNIRVNKLTAPDEHTSFGRTVAIEGNRALVSVSSDPGPTNNAGPFDGAVWAFDFSNWNAITQTEFGRPVTQFSDPPPPFGVGLDLVGTTAVIGAFNDPVGGAVYVYDVTNTQGPAQVGRIAASPGAGPFFGKGLEFDGRTVIAADLGGHAYLYQVVPEPSTFALLMFAVTTWRFRRVGPLRKSQQVVNA